jgi:hypothetical protein
MRRHLYPIRLDQIFPQYLITDTVLGGGFTEYEVCVLIFCTALSETFLIL